MAMAGQEVEVVPEISPKADARSLHVRGELKRNSELGTRVVGVVMFEGLVGEMTNVVVVCRCFYTVG